MRRVSSLIIGILALQGDFFEHGEALRRLGVSSREVRLPGDLPGIHGLIIPGGESTVLARLIDRFKLRQPLQRAIRTGLPVWGTCAGLIILSKSVRGPGPKTLGALNVEVSRNAFGSHVASFKTSITLPKICRGPVPAVFIRAPIITAVSPPAEVLGTLPGGTIVAVRQANVIGTAFHPELTGDHRLHRYFAGLADKFRLQRAQR